MPKKRVEIGLTLYQSAYGKLGHSNLATNGEATKVFKVGGPITLESIPIDYMNLMTYDNDCKEIVGGCCPPTQTVGPATGSYYPYVAWKKFLESFRLVSTNPDVLLFLRQNTNIGFEPEFQAYKGIPPPDWVYHDVAKLIKTQCYAGLITWSVNSQRRASNTAPIRGPKAVRLNGIFAKQKSSCKNGRN